MINEFKSENTSDNKIIFDTNIYGKNLMIEKPNKKTLKRAMSKEKFALGFSKLNKILSKNSKLCHIFTGLEITEKLYKWNFRFIKIELNLLILLFTNEYYIFYVLN